MQTRRAYKPTCDQHGKFMSYILDALKRADAERERERGAVPGLHARQATNLASPTRDRMSSRVWMVIAALLVLAGLVAAGLWFWQMPDAAVRPAALEPAAPQPTVPATMAQPAPTVPVVVATPAAASSSAPLPVPAASRSAPLPVPAASRSASRPASAVRSAAIPVQPKSKPETKSDPVTKEAVNQLTPPAVQLLTNLPEDLRRQIPPLAITGSVYSKNPDQRLLLVNNQVLSRGSLAAPEVTLEEIQAKSSVFSFRGTRFRVAH